MKRLIIIVAIVMLALLVVLHHCRHRHFRDPLATKIDTTCKIYFSRQSLGGSSSSIVPVLTDVVNGSSVSIVGTLKQVTREWIVIETDFASNPKLKQKLWLPRGVVLCVSTDVNQY